MSVEQKNTHTHLNWNGSENITDAEYQKKKAERKKCQPKWKMIISNFSKFCDCVCLRFCVCVYFTNTLTLITYKIAFAEITLKARLMSYPRDRHV